MKEKNLYSLILIGVLALCGCENKTQTDSSTSKWKETEALLLHTEKTMGRQNSVHSFFYFDTDGNPDTAEAMLHSESHSEMAHLLQFNNAKIGNYNSLNEWEKILTQKGDYIQWTGIHQQKLNQFHRYYKVKE